MDLKPEYERLKLQLQTATDQSAINFTKKRSVTAEMKHFKELQNEADKHSRVKSRWVKQTQTLHLWKLYHMDKQIENLQASIEADSQSTEKFTRKQGELTEIVGGAKKVYAKAAKVVLLAEKGVKERSREKLDLLPAVYEIDEAIAHGEKKVTVAKENKLDAQKGLDKVVAVVKGLERDLKAVDTRILAYDGNFVHL